MNAKTGWLVGVVVIGAAGSLFADLRLGAPFTDGAVLQRERKVPVWGTANPGSKVTVAFAGNKATAVAGKDGSWKVSLPAMAASKESRTLTVTEAGAKKSRAAIRDVLVGEVWFASGQSNMECPIWGESTRYRDGKGAMMTAMTRLPYVRFIKNIRTQAVKPTMPKRRGNGWQRFEPEFLANSRLSALAFYYARELYLALDVPIGIIDSSWGGTSIDPWTPRSGYADCDPSLRDTANYVVKPAKEWKKETDCMGRINLACQQPTVLWNGMVAVYAPMAMRGFIWYQGCANGGESQRYRAKLHALYNGWTREFANPDLKFYLVQLAPWRQNWMGICTAQNQFVAEQKNAAIAVTADVGNFDDIHPNDKEIVAKRLVIHALKRDYGFDTIAEEDSPVFRSAAFGEDGKVTLDFDHVKSWYVYARDKSLKTAFEVAGADGVWQQAKIVNFSKAKDKKSGKMTDQPYVGGAKLIVSSDKVAAPVKVRYMGRPRTAGTLYNQASLPLGPFTSESEAGSKPPSSSGK